MSDLQQNRKILHLDN